MSTTREVLTNGSFSLAPVLLNGFIYAIDGILAKKDNNGQDWRELRYHYKEISVYLPYRLLILKQGIHNIFT